QPPGQEIEWYKCARKYPPAKVVVILNQTGLHVCFIAHVNNHKHTNPVRDQRKNHTQSEQHQTRAKTRKVHLAVDQHQGLTNQQVTQSRTTMGHFKRTNANEIDKNTLNLEINIQKTKQHFVNSHGNKLKVPGQEVPDWHGQEKQTQWNEKPAHLPPAHQHGKAAQQQRNQRKLLQGLQTNQTTQPIAQKAKS